MAAEKIIHWDVYRLRLRQQYSGVDGDNTGHGGISTIGVSYSEGDSVISDGIALNIIAQNENGVVGAEETLVTLTLGAGLFSPATWVDNSIHADIETYVELYDFIIYWTDEGKWQVNATNLKWFVDGVEEYDRGTPILLELNTVFTPPVPSSIPLVGIPASLTASPHIGASLAQAPQTVLPAFLTQANVTADGGRSFKIGATWYELDVALDVLGIPSVTNTIQEPGIPSISATNQNDGTISLVGIKQSTGLKMIQEMNNATIPLYANLAKLVERISDDHLEMVARRTLPRVRWTASAVVDFSPPFNPDPIDSEVIYREMTPRLTYLLDSVDNDASALEEVFDLTTYTLYSINASRWEGTATTSYVRTAHSSLGLVEDNPPISVAALRHTNLEARYLNNVACPHWLCYDLFPQDTTEDGQDLWMVDGGPVPSLYWVHTRDQWNYHPVLPLEKNTKKRSSIVSNQLDDSEFSLYWEGLYGPRTTPWGFTRGKLIDLAPVSSRALTDDGWTFTGCTATFGASIILNPSTTSIVAECDLLTFSHEPYFYPAICDRVGLDWVLANIGAINAYYVNAYGEKELITDEPGTFNWRAYVDSYYIGDYDQDFSAGHGVTDHGTDKQANGRSSSAMGDEEQVAVYQLLNGRSGAKIRFEIDVLDTGIDVTLEYPVFHLAEDPILVNENGYHQVLVFPNGGAIRFGNWTWLQPAGFQNPPVINQIGVPPWGKKSTGIDLLAFMMLVCKGTDPSDIQTEIDALWDVNEGRTFADVDDTTIAFLIGGWQAIIVKNYGVPALCEFPNIPFDESVHMQKHHSLSFAKRRLISPHKEVHQFVDGVQWTSTGSLGIEGWKDTEHEHAVENDEISSIFDDAIELTDDTRPWRGHLIVTGRLRGGNGTAIHSCSTPMGLIHTALATDEGVDIEVWNRQGDDVLYEGPRDEDSTWVNIAYHPAGRLVLLFVAAGEVFRSESSSWSEDWETESLGMADIACIAIHPQTGVEFYALHDGTDTWELHRKNPDEASVFVADIATTTTIAGAGLCISPGSLNELVFTYIDGTTRIRTYSTDFGENWH